MKIDLQQLTQNYISTFESKLNEVLRFSENKKFEILEFDYHLKENLDLSFSDFEDVLYLIKIKNENFDSKKLCERIKKLKKSKKSVKFPRVNTENAIGNNKVLYIGKSTNNFKNRLEYHLGLKSKSTYALQLSYWLNDSFLKHISLELYYTKIDFSNINSEFEKKEILELLESSLHNEFKPLLGRSGH